MDNSINLLYLPCELGKVCHCMSSVVQHHFWAGVLREHSMGMNTVRRYSVLGVKCQAIYSYTLTMHCRHTSESIILATGPIGFLKFLNRK